MGRHQCPARPTCVASLGTRSFEPSIPSPLFFYSSITAAFTITINTISINNTVTATVTFSVTVTVILNPRPPPLTPLGPSYITYYCIPHPPISSNAAKCNKLHCNSTNPSQHPLLLLLHYSSLTLVHLILKNCNIERCIKLRCNSTNHPWTPLQVLRYKYLGSIFWKNGPHRMLRAWNGTYNILSWIQLCLKCNLTNIF